MRTNVFVMCLSLWFTIGINAQRKYVGVWESGSGSNLITKPMTWNAFLQKGEEMTQKGLRLDDVEIIKKGMYERYVGSWRSGSGNNIITKGLRWNAFLKKGEELTKKGYRLWDFEILGKRGTRFYVGNWRSGGGSNIITKGLKWKDFLKKGEELTNKGFRLWDFETYRANNIIWYVGNWRSGSGSNLITRGLPWKAFLKKGEELTAKGLRLYDVEIIKTFKVKRYVGAWRKGSGSNIVTNGLKWSDFLVKGEKLTNQGLRLTDFEMFMAPQSQKPDSDPDPDPTKPDLPDTPKYVKLLNGTLGNDKYRIVVDFTKIIDDKPEITIPTQFLKNLPWYEGEVVFPNNFCGLRVIKACKFVWLDGFGNVFDDFPYNSVPEKSSLKEHFQQGETLYLGGIDFTGPVGKCSNSKENWMFPFPFTQTETVMPQPLKLVIELEQGSEIQFLNFTLPGLKGKALTADKLFKPIDMDKMLKFYKKTFYDGFKQWVDVYCEDNPKECPLHEDKDDSK